MSEFLDRISKLSPQRLALLADELNQRVQAAEKSRRTPIAIVGIGCRFPGGVQEPEGFWKLLRDGTDAVREVPGSRWNVDDFYDPNPDTPGKMTTRWGGFVDNPDLFDPQFFGIAPGEALHMDPQQRLLLEISWEALEHAGIPPSGLMGTKTGVFIGICNNDYSQIALSAPREKITPYVASGLSHAVAAGRISYVLGLQGPNLAVDTSCSASLVAVHLACQSLRLGESDAALAGGVNLIFNPDITIALSQSRMMSPDGHCKAFSNLANGFVRGEGCGVIVLKRLPDALRDRNRILAVIRGSACNQDGRSSGLTAPNGPSQEAVLTAALNDAGLRPSDVDYIEAHGTGTALGDPIELEALHAIFKNRAQNSEPLFVGSVKTNLGHLESAAGIAGLVKLVLSIQHGEIPPSLHFEEPNHRIDWDRLSLEVPNRLQAWKRRGDRRAGGVSSFGFSGTNAHVVVEEYVKQTPAPAQVSSDRPMLFLLSAKTESALQTMEMRLRNRLMSNPTLSLADVAYTLNRGRSHFDFRAGIVAGSRDELIESLSRFSESPTAASIHTGHVATHSPRLAMIFDDGSWCRSNMARDLYETSPVFREGIQRCERALGNDLGVRLTALLYPERAFESAPDMGAEILPARSGNAAAFALQYALTGLWSSCGIKPAVVGGWGVGEYVAACVAEIFPLGDALQLAIAEGSENSGGNIGNVLSVQPNAPHLVFVANDFQSSRASAGTAEYWQSRPQSAKLSEAALAALEQEACTAVLTMSSEAALHHGKALGERLVPSLERSSVACPQFLKAAAALYMLGCELDLANLYNDVSAKLVSLPTYPFERERYWLEFDNARQSPRDAKWDAGQKTPYVGETQAARVDPIEPDSPMTIEDGWIYDLVWEEKPLVARKSSPSNVESEDALLSRLEKISPHSGRNWVLFADDLGVGEALQSLLIASGNSCQVIRQSASARELAIAIDALLVRSEASDTEIVYLWGLNAADIIDSTATLLESTNLSSNLLVAVIQRMLAEGDRTTRLTIATRGAQATPYRSPSAGGAAQSLAWGIGRTFGLEYPKHFRALIDLDSCMMPESAAAILFSELIANDKEDQIALHAGKRLVVRLIKANLGKESARTPDGLRGDGSYLIVGGLGGVGLRVAQWAAQQRPGHLVLLGRTGLGAKAGRFAAERSEAIRRMEMQGVPITVIEADVASKAELASLFQRFGAELPPLRGVFHAATVFSSAELTELTEQKMDEMLRAKVLGTWVLHELTKNLNLDFFLAFSSTASILGARDMAHYVAANQFIDAFSHHRRAVGLPMLSVNWGTWDVMRLASQQDQAFLEEIGILPMQSDSILSLFKKLIASSRAQIVIANIDWNVLKPVFETHRIRPLLEKFSRTKPKRKNSAVPAEIPLAKLEMAIGMTPKQRRKFIEEFVLEHAGHVLGFRRGELPPADVPLTDLGLDSLMAVDLKNRLQAGLGQELSPTIIFDYPTISNIVGLLETLLLATHGSTEPDFLSADQEEIRI